MSLDNTAILQGILQALAQISQHMNMMGTPPGPGSMAPGAGEAGEADKAPKDTGPSSDTEGKSEECRDVEKSNKKK